ncbi:cupin superfamily barrel domain protein [Geotalea daltonii FRC-32]|uniref:Cupin superfamily barrel domain protein n=1 Tax=Geotalea daltonii (strain DSM 22248 / JCM 15807 / FRC-32) TaxID=316067 RepID=B9M092_GEODF|nr:cupin domain-containing protein [Geotalea daltonii]ACM20872.1 cupin superfamily barrel domain protein [Geotalea daltonii FRC-32]
MKSKWLSVVLLVLVSLSWVTAGLTAEKKKGSATDKIILAPNQLQWKNGPPSLPTSKVAVLEGNPKKKGFFVMRLMLPAGTKIPTHIHDNVERVTVISGSINLAMGDEQKSPTVLPAGGYFSLPAGLVHNAWVDEETILQIATTGPWSLKVLKAPKE